MDAVSIIFLFTSLIFFSYGPTVSNCASVPSSFNKCSKSDPKINDCMKNAIETAMVAMKDGIPSVQLLPIDPLAITHITIQQGENRPVNVKIDLSNAKLTGLSATKVKETRTDIGKRFFDVDAFSPGLELEGDYDMDGKFLLVPLKGKGKCKMTLTKFNANIKLQGEPVTKNGEIYWDIKMMKIHITNATNFKVNFENLFNGDKVLGDSTNKVLNENWPAFWEELRPSMEETFDEVFRNVANVVFRGIKEKELFLD